MTKTLLIPVDFRVESLNTLRCALADQAEPVNIILLYGHHLSDAISDLLFYSPARTLAALMEEPFREALNIIKNRYSNIIVQLRIELLNKNSGPLLKNLLRTHGVHLAYVPATYRLKPGSKGFDLMPLLKKQDLPLREVGWSQQVHGAHDQLQALFLPVNTLG